MSKKKYYLSLLAVFKNESHIMEEWIEHYLMRGFSHIYLINDHSTDNFLPIIDRYKDFITLYDNEVVEEKDGRQVRVYEAYGKEALRDSTWLAVMDLDEFLYSPIHPILTGYFLRCELKDVAQVVVDWVHFGSSHFLKQPKNVVQEFCHIWNLDDFRITRFCSTKSIFQTKYWKSFLVHEHEMINGKEKTIRVGWNNGRKGALLVNHYTVQSLHFWMNIKGTRGDVNRYLQTQDRNLALFQEQDHNDVQDHRLALQTQVLLEKKSKITKISHLHKK